MKFTAHDLKNIRWHIGIAVGLLLAAGALTWLSLTMKQKTDAEHLAAATRHGQSEARLRQARTEEQEIKEKGALFQHLLENGIIGEERRLDWIEMLTDVQRRLRIPGMSYEFAPQKPLSGNTGGNHVFFVSTMKVHLNVVHEEDLLNFLEAVQQEAKAMVLTRQCNLTRRSPAEAGTTLAYLSADCELDWITARKGEGTTP